MIIKKTYTCFDLETGNEEVNNRTANFMFNDIVCYSIRSNIGTNKDIYVSDLTNVEEDIVTDLKKTDVFVAFNAKFDMLYLWNELQPLIQEGKKVFCPQLAHYIMTGEKFPALREIAVRDYNCPEREKNIDKYFEEGYATQDIPPEELLFDSANDTEDLERIYLKQQGMIDRRGRIFKNFVETQMDFLLATTEMEFNGFKIDVKNLKELDRGLEVELQQNQEEIESLIEKYWHEDN